MSNEDFLARLERLEKNQAKTSNSPELDNLKRRHKSKSSIRPFITLAVVVVIMGAALMTDVSAIGDKISNYLGKTKEKLFVAVMTSIPTPS